MFYVYAIKSVNRNYIYVGLSNNIEILKIDGPGVEIGRQATLRWWCFHRRAGSNPVPGTLPLLVGVFYCPNHLPILQFITNLLFLQCLTKSL